jgi:lipoprotein-anchoring transpeptidase ErfK/SrfK
MKAWQLPLLIILLTFLSFTLAYFKSLPSLFSWQNQINPTNLKSFYDPSEKVAIFNNHSLKTPSFDFDNKVLGDTDTQDSVVDNKRIEVDLATQHLYAYEDNNLVYSFVISSGKWDRTPNGTFKIWTKILSQKMSGGSKELGTYYYLPNVPYIMFFYNEKYEKKLGFSIHGTYWHNNFGVPMSHGCINMRTAEVKDLYSWANINTPIIIYGKYDAKLSSKAVNLPNADL